VEKNGCEISGRRENNPCALKFSILRPDHIAFSILPFSIQHYCEKDENE